MAAIFKFSLQNLSPLPTSLEVEPLAKPKTSLKFFVNTTNPKTKVLVVFGQKLETKYEICEYGPRTRNSGTATHLVMVTFVYFMKYSLVII